MDVARDSENGNWIIMQYLSLQRVGLSEGGLQTRLVQAARTIN